MEETRKKILVVDDDPDDCKIVSMVLEPEGYTVITAENGRVALEKAASEQPDLILLDVMMPEMDGFSACAKLKASAQSKNIPVILLTGVAKHITKSKYPLDGVMRAEAEEYLEKPLKPEDLIRLVSTYLK